MAPPSKLDDLGEALWISQNTTSLESKGEWIGNFVSHCVPTIYPAYCKVFHPIYEDASIKDRDVTWDDLTRKRPRNLEDPLEKVLGKSTTVYGGIKYDPKNLKPISWRELAERYGLQFHPELTVDSFTRNFPGGSWPRYLIGPDEGQIEMNTLKAIALSIAKINHDFEFSQPCYFHYDLTATESWENNLLFQGKLLHIFDTSCLDDVNTTTPTHWWPANREWFVTSDGDLAFTLIGGSTDLVNSLIWSSNIECVRVTPTTRIDFKSDQINP